MTETWAEERKSGKSKDLAAPAKARKAAIIAAPIPIKG